MRCNYADDRKKMISWGKIWEKIPLPGLPKKRISLPDTKHLQCQIMPQAQQTIEDHAHESSEIEVGGLLLGEVYQEGEIYFVLVTEALPARHTDAGSVFLTFTGQTWIDIIARRASYPDKKTVGWYHSHPGMGIFLSGYDEFIHREFFHDQPWYIALVIDPIYGEQGIFTWNGNEIIRYPDQSIHSENNERKNTL